jgi:hypothetical protein
VVRCGGSANVGGRAFVEVDVPAEHVDRDVSVDVPDVEGVVFNLDVGDGFEVVAEFAQQDGGPAVASDRGGGVAIREGGKAGLQ